MMTASMSVFDLNGTAFLWFYVVAFCCALAWSIQRRTRANAKFSLPAAGQTPLTDPYEIAYLAAGAPRCAQVAVVKLIKCGAVEWARTPVLRESRLVAKSHAEPVFNEIERALYSSIHSYGKKGMALTDVSQLVATKLSGIESRLAKLGLRPTASEAGSRGCFIMLPMLVLMAIGAVKVAVGIARDKPVIYLVILIFFTFIVAALVAANTKKLTPAGEGLLARLRASNGRSGAADPLDASLCHIALLGISAAVAADPLLAGLDSALTKDISKIGQQGGSSGCGTSSGCSSGCGGGGCGGCGGD